MCDKNQDPNEVVDERIEERIFSQKPKIGRPVASFDDILEYEVGSFTVLQSLFYLMFPGLFARKVLRKHDRYENFKKQKEAEVLKSKYQFKNLKP